MTLKIKKQTAEQIKEYLELFPHEEGGVLIGENNVVEVADFKNTEFIKLDDCKDLLKERDKQWEDAIDKCTPDGSIKIIKKYLEDWKMNETIKIDGIEYVRKDSQTERNYMLATPKGNKPYVIVRTDRAGVFAGYLYKRNNTEATILNARRLWYWKGASSLSQLAVDGVKYPNECKFPCEVSKVEVTGVIEILEVTEKARLSIKGVPEWKQ